MPDCPQFKSVVELATMLSDATETILAHYAKGSHSAIVVTYCEQCDCIDVNCVTAEGGTAARAVEVLEAAYGMLSRELDETGETTNGKDDDEESGT